LPLHGDPTDCYGGFFLTRVCFLTSDPDGVPYGGPDVVTYFFELELFLRKPEKGAVLLVSSKRIKQQDYLTTKGPPRGRGHGLVCTFGAASLFLGGFAGEKNKMVLFFGGAWGLVAGSD